MRLIDRRSSDLAGAGIQSSWSPTVLTVRDQWSPTGQCAGEQTASAAAFEMDVSDTSAQEPPAMVSGELTTFMPAECDEG